MGINDDLKRQIREHMQHEGISQADLGRRLGIPSSTVAQMLQLKGSRSNVPKFIVSILEELGLEIIVQPRAAGAGNPNAAVKRAILKHMEREGINQNQLARRLGVERQNVNQVLTIERSHSNIAKGLINMLEELGLELVVQPKRKA